MNDPLLEALESLREIDGEYVAAHPDTADAEVAERMRNLRLVVTAIDELAQRDEEANPEAVREEMRVIAAEFVFVPRLLLELEEGFLADGDTENATTIRQAFEWMRRQMFDGQVVD